MSITNSNYSNLTRETVDSSINDVSDCSDATIFNSNSDDLDLCGCARFLYGALFRKVIFRSRKFSYKQLLEICAVIQNGCYICFGCGHKFHINNFNSHLFQIINSIDSGYITLKCVRHGSVGCMCHELFPDEITVKFYVCNQYDI